MALITRLRVKRKMNWGESRTLLKGALSMGKRKNKLKSRAGGRTRSLGLILFRGVGNEREFTDRRKQKKNDENPGIRSTQKRWGSHLDSKEQREMALQGESN